MLYLWSNFVVIIIHNADFITNLLLNPGVNANWLLTGQGDMFNGESSAVETGMQPV